MGKMLLLIIAFLVIGTQTQALAPPDEIEKWNLEAELIVYGQVGDVDLSADKPYFKLVVQTIIKGFDGLNTGDTITVYCDLPQQSDVPGLVATQQGIVYVRVAEGNHVIAYLNNNSEGNYKPVLQGLSVIVTETLNRP